jgi:hypothetical protein
MAPKKKQPKKQTSKRKKSVQATQKTKSNKPPKKQTNKLVRRARRPPPVVPNEAALIVRGGGPRTAGQSGDTEGLSDAETVDSESVQELVEEGQDFEAELVDAVTNARDPDEGELDAEVPAEDDQGAEDRSFSKRNRL